MQSLNPTAHSRRTVLILVSIQMIILLYFLIEKGPKSKISGHTFQPRHEKKMENTTMTLKHDFNPDHVIEKFDRFANTSRDNNEDINRWNASAKNFSNRTALRVSEMLNVCKIYFYLVADF